MVIKDYCDIHGEPICVGDTVRVFLHSEKTLVIGKVHLLTGKAIDLINDDGSFLHFALAEGDEIEVISKCKGKFESVVSDLIVEPEPVDMVNHPPHYQSENGIEVIDVIEAFTADLKGGEATNTGNVIKYMLRWAHKENPLQDLKKARWYLDRLIKIVEKKEKENAK